MVFIFHKSIGFFTFPVSRKNYRIQREIPDDQKVDDEKCHGNFSNIKGGKMNPSIGGSGTWVNGECTDMPDTGVP